MLGQNTMNPVTEAIAARVEGTPSSLQRKFGPAFTFKEINFLRWTILILTAAGSWLRPLLLQLQSGGFLRNFKGDFIYFYSFGRILNQYPPARLYDYDLQLKILNELHPLSTLEYGPNPYPPFVAILFQPFAHMSYFAAYLLWLVISFGLYTAGLSLVTRRFLPLDPYRRALIFCFALGVAPFLTRIKAGGPISAIGFFAIALAFCLEDLERPMLSGLALSLCLYKPTLLVLLLPMLLITRRYRTLLGFICGATGLVLFGISFAGVGVWSGYIHMLLSFGSQVTSTQPFRLPWIYADLGAFANFIPGGRSWAGRVVFIGFAGWAAVSLLRVWERSGGARKPASTLMWATTLTWTLVLNVYVPLYDLILVVISLVATFAALKDLSGQPIPPTAGHAVGDHICAFLDNAGFS